MNPNTRIKMHWRKGDTLQVFNVSTTTNLKVSNTNQQIVQHYSYSRDQFEHVKNGGTILGLFDHDKETCFNCPFSKNAGYKLGKCYTHKFSQARGFYSMLRSISGWNDRDLDWEEIPEMPKNAPALLLELCKNRFVRFGTYGETVLIPLNWVRQITDVAKSWTGYTHQWHRPEYAEYKAFFMASVHMFEQRIAEDQGWRVFNITETEEKIDKNVICPADSEKGIACNSCGLCSGTGGKGKYSVQIKYH